MKEIYEKVDPDVEKVAQQVVDAAYKLHSTLGPGLLESVYEAFLCHELKNRGLKVEKQVALPLTYEGLTIDGGLRLDLSAKRNQGYRLAESR